MLFLTIAGVVLIVASVTIGLVLSAVVLIHMLGEIWRGEA